MKYYICPECGRVTSRKKLEIEHRKRCICGAEIDRKMAGLPEPDQERHFLCAYCGTDNTLNPERTPSNYTLHCQKCGRKIAEVHKYAPIVYGGRGYA